MTKLHLGVVVIPHPTLKRHSGKTWRSRQAIFMRGPVLTTGQLAHILEANYGIMGQFVSHYGRATIRDLFVAQTRKQIRSVVRGKPMIGEPMQKALDDIQKRFRTFIRTKEAEGVVVSPKGFPVPTMAALGGYRHSRQGAGKMTYRRGPRRPSFMDTEAYVRSFKAWMD